jgi:hypothetical protein
MANIKTGLAFYRIDTDRYQDIRIRRLKNAFGCSGIAVHDYILCEIYRVRGCFIEWDGSTAFDVAEYFGLKENLVIEIVNYCGVVGLFDKALLTGGSVAKSTQAMNQCGMVGGGSSVPACGGIITSKSIQSRYIEMCMRTKRKGIIIPEQCRITTEECEIIPEQCRITTEECETIPEQCRITTEECNKKKKRKESGQRKENIYNNNKYNLSISTNVENAMSNSPEETLTPSGAIDYKALIEFFNRETKGVFGNVRYPITGKREGAIRARIREHGKEAFVHMIQLASKSDFLKGDNQRGFTATFDWLIKPNNFQKVIEGNYGNRPATSRAANNGAIDKPSAKTPRDYSQRF